MLVRNVGDGKDRVINAADYGVTEKLSGIDELSFSLPSKSPMAYLIHEMDRILVTENHTWFVVTQITSGDGTAEYKAVLDLETFKQDILEHVRFHESDFETQLRTFLPAGWTYDPLLAQTAISGLQKDWLFDGGTRLDGMTALADKWGVSYRYNTNTKEVVVFDAATGYLGGASGSNLRLTVGSNLRSINYTGTADDFCTRLYAYGKGGVTLETVNANSQYIENNTYSRRLVCGRYSNTEIGRPAELLDAAKKELAKRCKPKTSYECDFVDLAKAAGQDYKAMEIHVPYIITVSDSDRQTVEKQIVSEYTWYARHPEKNKITLSSRPDTLQSDLQNVASLTQSLSENALMQNDNALNGSITAKDANGNTVNCTVQNGVIIKEAST